MNRNKQILSKSLLVFFTVLISLLALLYIASWISARKNTSENKKAIVFFDSVLTEKNAGVKQKKLSMIMPSLSFENTDYSAILDIPSHDVHLPVRSKWQSQFFDAAPCCLYGSCYDSSLIIGGADHKGQFDFISDIDIGESVTVTDMTGTFFSYKIEKVKHSDNPSKSVLANNDYDLTFYAKSNKTHDYIIVQCLSNY